VRVGQAPRVESGLAGKRQRLPADRDGADPGAVEQRGHRQQLTELVVRADAAQQRVLDPLVDRLGRVRGPHRLAEADHAVRLGEHPPQSRGRFFPAPRRLSPGQVSQRRLETAPHRPGGRQHRGQVLPRARLRLHPGGQRRGHRDLGGHIVAGVAGGAAGAGRPVLHLAEERGRLLGGDRGQEPRRCGDRPGSRPPRARRRGSAARTRSRRTAAGWTGPRSRPTTRPRMPPGSRAAGEVADVKVREASEAIARLVRS
jgi:hypothetical protein